MAAFKVLLFSALKERVGAPAVDVQLAPGATVEDLVEALSDKHPAVAAFKPVLRVAVNLCYADRQTPLREGDEVAIITPTSGG